MGPKPKAWDRMPKYNRHWYHKMLRRKTKADIIEPVLTQIRLKVSEKEISMYHIVCVLGETNEAFEQWWSKNGKPCPN